MRSLNIFSQFLFFDSPILKKIFFLIFILFTNLIFSQTKTPLDYVNPKIGTAHSRWFFYTPAAVPFGMAKLGPSTNAHYGNKSGWEAVGYDYRDESIEGFAAFHEFQIGGIVTAASVGKLQTVPGDLKNPESGYRSRFEKNTEIAKPGYYSVVLKDYDIKAEMTATQRVAFQRYTFPKSDASHILFDIGNQQGESGKVKKAFVQMTDKNHIEGYVITEPEYVKAYQNGAAVSLFFYAKINKVPKKWGSFVQEKIQENNTSSSEIGSGMYLPFDTKDQEQIEIKIGLSYTSIENAQSNLKIETEKINFDQAHQNAEKTWLAYLNRIKIESKDEAAKTKFYTGLFHALLGRGLASDCNGMYPKNDGGVGQIPLQNDKPVHNHYNTDAVWGAFWNLTPLWALVYPEYYSDFVQSQLLVYQDSGWLADGIANSRYVSGVGTNFVGLVIAGAYNCGIRDFDIQKAYKAALKNETEWRNRPEGAGKIDNKVFVEKNVIPYSGNFGKTYLESSAFAASHTLEYAFSSYAVAQMAKKVGTKAEVAQLLKQSKAWENLWDSKTQLIRPKNADDSFVTPFDKYEPWLGYQEGNAIQYTFYVPHEPEILIAKMGQETFNNRLDSIFQLAQKSQFGGGTEIDAFSGIKAVYNHGNQPNLHISWLFNFSKKPSLTQKWTRAICNEFYGTEGIHGYGYGQDEDQGQLGAWYVMSSMGLFDVRGLANEKPDLQIGSPIFDKITIALSPKYYSGKTFVIETNNNSKDNFYVQKMSWNTKPHTEFSLPFAEITKGGILKLEMSKTPFLKSNP